MEPMLSEYRATPVFINSMISFKLPFLVLSLAVYLIQIHQQPTHPAKLSANPFHFTSVWKGFFLQ